MLSEAAAVSAVGCLSGVAYATLLDFFPERKKAKAAIENTEVSKEAKVNSNEDASRDMALRVPIAAEHLVTEFAKYQALSSSECGTCDPDTDRDNLSSSTSTGSRHEYQDQVDTFSSDASTGMIEATTEPEISILLEEAKKIEVVLLGELAKDAYYQAMQQDFIVTQEAQINDLNKQVTGLKAQLQLRKLKIESEADQNKTKAEPLLTDLTREEKAKVQAFAKYMGAKALKAKANAKAKEAKAKVPVMTYTTRVQLAS